MTCIAPVKPSPVVRRSDVPSHNTPSLATELSEKEGHRESLTKIKLKSIPILMPIPIPMPFSMPNPYPISNPIPKQVPKPKA